MVVRLRFFASLRERLHRTEAEYILADGATLTDLWAALCADHPQLVELQRSISFAVNQEYVGPEQRLSNNDEVALIPPVSGGVDV